MIFLYFNLLFEAYSFATWRTGKNLTPGLTSNFNLLFEAYSFATVLVRDRIVEPFRVFQSSI